MREVLHSFGYSLDYLRELVADVAEGDMVGQPEGIVNHPAWVIGHLTMTCQEIGGVVGVRPWLGEEWRGRFFTGSVPVGDVGAYPTKAEALARLGEAQSRVVRAVEEAPGARLDEPFPDPSYRDVFPTVRHALTQVLVGHTAYHVGQVAVWRRAMGLGAMKRSYE